MPRGDRTKCDKCGQIVQGGRLKLNQHKKESHSIDIIKPKGTAGDSTKIEEAANYGQVEGIPAA